MRLYYLSFVKKRRGLLKKGLLKSSIWWLCAAKRRILLFKIRAFKTFGFNEQDFNKPMLLKSSILTSRDNKRRILLFKVFDLVAYAPLLSLDVKIEKRAKPLIVSRRLILCAAKRRILLQPVFFDLKRAVCALQYSFVKIL